ncbi:MAG: archaemetzincin family Zn-dependent metalloprotease [Prolixibacteraceae bacterium]
MDEQRILLVSHGQFGNEFLEEITRDVQIFFDLPVRYVIDRTDLVPFFDASRRQYDANKILKHLDAASPSENVKILGLYKVDLFIPILTYIFGQAVFRGKTGAVSIYRLRNEQYGMPRDEKLLYERFRKVVFHELGHAFGLIHCHVPSCIMRSSTYVEDIDQKKHLFCPKCREELDIFIGRRARLRNGQDF